MTYGKRIVHNLETGQTLAVDLTPEEVAARDTERAALAAADSADEQIRSTLRNQVLSVAGSAEGVLLTDLTAAQVKALVAVLLWKAGGLTNDGHVKALNEWVR